MREIFVLHVCLQFYLVCFDYDGGQYFPSCVGQEHPSRPVAQNELQTIKHY